MEKIIKLINEIDIDCNYCSIRIFGDYSGRIYDGKTENFKDFKDLNQAKKILKKILKNR